MKRAVQSSLRAILLLGAVHPAPGQPPLPDFRNRPDAAQLLDVPVSGNPISGRPIPEIRNPYGDDPNAIVRGEQLFAAMNCNGCHAPLGGGGMGPPLSDREWIYGGTPAAIYLSIYQGRPNGMPAWGRSLPPEALWNLMAYVRTLSQAPPPESGTSKHPAHPKHPVPNPLGPP